MITHMTSAIHVERSARGQKPKVTTKQVLSEKINCYASYLLQYYVDIEK
jgi:hypothetical protein